MKKIPRESCPTMVCLSRPAIFGFPELDEAVRSCCCTTCLLPKFPTGKAGEGMHETERLFVSNPGGESKKNRNTMVAIAHVVFSRG